MTRPTHRVRYRSAPGAPTQTLDLRLGDDGIARTAEGAAIASLGDDGEWYWLDGVPPAHWRVIGVDGRPRRSASVASRQIAVKFDDALVTIRLTTEERDAWIRAAGDLSLSAWIRQQAGRARRGPIVRERCNAAAGIPAS